MKNSRAFRGALALSTAGLLAFAGAALASDSAQFSPACDKILVNKAVGAEQWAITLDIGTRDVLGNVFRTDGGPASFLSCDFQGSEDGVATYDCIGAQGCVFPPFCGGEQWTPIATVEVPESFFLPEGLDELGLPDEVCVDATL
jgi:hypothetical protein